MTAFGAPAETPRRIRSALMYLIGIAGLAGGRVVVTPRRPNTLTSTVLGRPSGDAERDAEHDAPASSADVSARLERLARLRRAGDLTDPEFEAAKRATLDEAGR